MNIDYFIDYTTYLVPLARAAFSSRATRKGRHHHCIRASNVSRGASSGRPFVAQIRCVYHIVYNNINV